MPRPDKVQAVEEISERLQAATATFVTEYRGLSVGQLQELRSKLRESGGSYKVYKMTLARLAAEDAGVGELNEWLGGPTAIAFADEDPVAVAKTLSEFAERHELFIIKGGMLSGEVITPEIVAKLATIDSREVLLAKIAGAAKAPLVKMAGMMASFTRDAASMFSQLLESKEADAPEPEPAEDHEPEPAPDPATADVAEVSPVEREGESEAPAEQSEDGEDEQVEATDADGADAISSDAQDSEPETDDDGSGEPDEPDGPKSGPVTEDDNKQDSTDDESAEGDSDGSEEE